MLLIRSQLPAHQRAGYTGQLTAEHIAAHLPTNLKWAVAGRSETKLQGVIEGCRKVNPDRKDPGEAKPIYSADVQPPRHTSHY